MPKVDLNTGTVRIICSMLTTNRSILVFASYFYQKKSEKSRLTLGIHSAKMEDGYLLNERMIGLSYKLTTGKFIFGLTGGNCNQRFCKEWYLFVI